MFPFFPHNLLLLLFGNMIMQYYFAAFIVFYWCCCGSSLKKPYIINNSNKLGPHFILQKHKATPKEKMWTIFCFYVYICITLIQFMYFKGTVYSSNMNVTIWWTVRCMYRTQVYICPHTQQHFTRRSSITDGKRHVTLHPTMLLICKSNSFR